MLIIMTSNIFVTNILPGVRDEDIGQPGLAVAAPDQPRQHQGVESLLHELQRGQAAHEVW